MGTPGQYDRAVRLAGNAKAPGGYAFRTKVDAEAYLADHPELPYRPYEMELPDSFEKCATADYWAAQVARHAWHEPTVPIMTACGICEPRLSVVAALDCHLLLVEAPFVNPDTDQRA